MAEEMLRSLKAWPLLDGFRGRPVADVAAAAAAIESLSRAALALGPQAREIEVNPLQVRASGEGAAALDALIVGAP
jgi:succinyl-CoA synthetase beta subunit